jgi:Signal peptidase, peptidase S26
MSRRANMPIPVVVAMAVSVVALAALWVSPVVGLVLAAAVVVAGPGDTIAVRDGLVVRNGRAISEPYARRCTNDICEMPLPITVPDGARFLAGDFRGESDDSRFWGPVPTKAIMGVVKYRYWPLKNAGRF